MIFQSLDLQTKKLLLLFLSCLLFWWLVLAPATCSAGNGAKMYTVTELELQTLEQNLTKLKQLSVTQQQESVRLKDTLTKSAQELQMLKDKLNTSTAQLTQAQESLANANQLLKEYAAEEKRTRLRIKRQRNMWIGLTITAIVIAVATHN